MMTEAERLAAYDRMYADLLKERDKVLADMDLSLIHISEPTRH